MLPSLLVRFLAPLFPPSPRTTLVGRFLPGHAVAEDPAGNLRPAGGLLSKLLTANSKSALEISCSNSKLGNLTANSIISRSNNC
ncbi:hypothetical protein CEXT_485591 [Caerostris extrusa]|uniref:Secreted protein n=1 Tax=Caerostris extrusa TaxID=172846 RepID=A0AAV4W1H2_CAEEX|nr:hypothetical protein CEXT_485591 [Caerostris extrusa]